MQLTQLLALQLVEIVEGGVMESTEWGSSVLCINEDEANPCTDEICITLKALNITKCDFPFNPTLPAITTVIQQVPFRLPVPW